MPSDPEMHRHVLINQALRMSDEEKSAILRMDEVSWSESQTADEYERRLQIQTMARAIRDEANRINQDMR
jgi:hypothetical protein